MIKRFYNIANLLEKGKALVVYGPRQVGKTTLLNNFLSNTKLKYKLDSGEDLAVQNILSSQDFRQILGYVEGLDVYAIDEAQNIPNIGLALKIIVDQRPDIRVIATGSSSFELAGQVGEPLTGRKRTINLYPISQIELLQLYNKFDLSGRKDEYLVFGSYPQTINLKNKSQKVDYLMELTHSYLLKDILALERVKGSQVLLDLLKLLAFQLGSEVSLNELATQLKIDVKTVDRYLDLLEKSFVIFRLTGFSRNLRKEVTKKNKYYFFDNGIRNAVISQFNPINLRNDVGQLWENFIVSERLKKRAYKKIYGSSYFWRTYEQQEVDLVEEREGALFGYEIKYSTEKKAKLPKDWLSTYSNATYKVINFDNYLDFVV